MVYVEPHAAVPLNNELGAARGRARAAEDAILWRVTGAVADAMEEIEGCYTMVRASLRLKKWGGEGEMRAKVRCAGG